MSEATDTMIQPLTAGQLYRNADLAKLDFSTTAELEPIDGLVGQTRALDAIRFGTHEAHGKANLIEFNYLSKEGAITLDPETDRYTVHVDRMPTAVRSLTHDLCMIEAEGDYSQAEMFIEAYAQVPEELERQLAKLADIPTDIEPIYRAGRFLSGGS